MQQRILVLSERTRTGTTQYYLEDNAIIDMANKLAGEVHYAHEFVRQSRERYIGTRPQGLSAVAWAIAEDYGNLRYPINLDARQIAQYIVKHYTRLRAIEDRVPAAQRDPRFAQLIYNGLGVEIA